MFQPGALATSLLASARGVPISDTAITKPHIRRRNAFLIIPLHAFKSRDALARHSKQALSRTKIPTPFSFGSKGKVKVGL